MPARLPPEPIADLTAEERAVILAALSQYEVAKRYAGELESKGTVGGLARRKDLFRESQLAGRICDRLLME